MLSTPEFDVLIAGAGPAGAHTALRLARLLAEDRSTVDGALEVLRGSAQRVDDARLWVRAGDYLMERGEALAALQHYFEAEKLRPRDEQIRARIEAARRKL